MINYKKQHWRINKYCNLTLIEVLDKNFKKWKYFIKKKFKFDDLKTKSGRVRTRKSQLKKEQYESKKCAMKKMI